MRTRPALAPLAIGLVLLGATLAEAQQAALSTRRRPGVRPSATALARRALATPTPAPVARTQADPLATAWRDFAPSEPQAAMAAGWESRPSADPGRSPMAGEVALDAVGAGSRSSYFPPPTLHHRDTCHPSRASVLAHRVAVPRPIVRDEPRPSPEFRSWGEGPLPGLGERGGPDPRLQARAPSSRRGA